MSIFRVLKMGCLKLTYRPQMQVLRTRKPKDSHEAKVVQWWLRVNPLAEKYYNGTLYAYCLNNPIRFIYQDGKMTVDALGDKGEDFCITLEIMLEIRKAVICP
jgi:hypothetical protein